MTAHEETLTVVREFFDALSTDDWSTIRSLAADELLVGDSDLSPKQLLDAFGDGAFEQAAPVLAEHFAPQGVAISAEEFIDAHRSWREHHSEEYHLDHLSVEAGDRVVYLASLTESQVGVFYGHPPRDEDITVTELGVVRIEDGVVREHRVAFDTNDFLAQMGMIPGDPYEAKVETQFYRVVNRVLRHNLRNDLNAIDGYAGLIRDGDGRVSEYADRIRATTSELLGMAEKVRQFEREVLHVSETHAVDLRAVARSVVDRQQDAAPGADIRLTAPEEPIVVTAHEALVRLALEESVRNAVEHTDADTPRIDVAVADGDEFAATVSVADNGPGIPAAETAPLFQERESALEHASSVGLWIIKWSVERLGGEIGFADNDPRGSVVRLHLPDSSLEEEYMY